MEKLKGIDEEYAEILKNSKQMDDERKYILCQTLNSRIEMLKNVPNQRAK